MWWGQAVLNYTHMQVLQPCAWAAPSLPLSPCLLSSAVPDPFPQRTAFSVGCSPSGIALPVWGGFHCAFCEWVKCSL